MIVVTGSSSMVITAWYAEHRDEAGVIVLNDFALGDLFAGGEGFQTQLRKQGFINVRNLATEEELEAAITLAKGKKGGDWSGPWRTHYPWEGVWKRLLLK